MNKGKLRLQPEEQLDFGLHMKIGRLRSRYFSWPCLFETVLGGFEWDLSKQSELRSVCVSSSVFVRGYGYVGKCGTVKGHFGGLLSVLICMHDAP